MKVSLTMIRKYKDTDIDQLVSTWRVSTEFAHPFLAKEFLDKETIALRDVYIHATEIWVTELDKRVVGFIAMMDNEIAALFLDPDFHGRKLGKAMVDMIVELKGPLTVEVFKENSVGRRFYDIYGFLKKSEYRHNPTGMTVLKMSLQQV